MLSLTRFPVVYMWNQGHHLLRSALSCRVFLSNLIYLFVFFRLLGYENPLHHDNSESALRPQGDTELSENHQRHFIIAEPWQRGAISQGVRIQIRGSREEGLRMDMKNLRGEMRNIREIIK